MKPPYLLTRVALILTLGLPAIVLMSPAQTARAQDLSDGLVGYWRFDEPAGATTAVDSAGTPDDASLIADNAASDFVTGQSGNAFNFVNSGSRPYFSAPSSPELNSISNAVTIAAWVYLSGQGTDSILARQLGNGIWEHYGLFTRSDRHLMFSSGTITAEAPVASAVPINTWTHVAATYDKPSKTVRLYVGGTQVYQNTNFNPPVPMGPDTTPVTLGATIDNAAPWAPAAFQGKMDEVVLYGRALAATEIQALAQGAIPLLPPGVFDGVVDACQHGFHPVGRAAYNFEDVLDLIPSGGTTPAYPDVDVRAVVRYPAQSSGDDTPIAGGRFPLVVFLHGNHATCPCDCSHSCAPADRIPNHIGYNYLLDVLASQGFIAVSVDGFDVTCTGSALMSDYEARGRLVLRHLELWRDWNASGGDPWADRFRGHVDMARIGLSGHSRGGEGVVAAEEINRLEGLGFDIKAINAIAPTDQDPFIRWVPEAAYYLLLAAADGDVSNLQGLGTYDRTSLQGASTQAEKALAWVYGANHNFFNSAWTPGNGIACAGDDGFGEGRLSPKAQQLTACQTIVPFFRLQLRNETAFRALFQGDLRVEGLDGVEMYWAHQHPQRLEVDNFDDGNGPMQNSLGGSVTVSAAMPVFDEFEFRPSGTTFDSSFRGDTNGLVLAWDSDRSYTTTLPPGQRNVSSFRALSLRIAQLLSQTTRNPLDEPKTLRITLRTGSGTVANTDVDLAGVETVPYPYEYNGGKTILTTLRVPLSSFRHDENQLPLTDIAAVVFELPDRGALAIDDIQFTR